MPFTRDTDVFEEFEVFSDKMRKCIRYLSEPYLEKEGLRSHHVVFLFAIEKEDGMSQKDLKEHLPYDQSRISMVVSELISRGLVT
ncbi:MAG: MarR family transcriptional regulator, partial [archaeon]|nr:MarR family transcriptional regulator [archaeon]